MVQNRRPGRVVKHTEPDPLGDNRRDAEGYDASGMTRDDTDTRRSAWPCRLPGPGWGFTAQKGNPSRLSGTGTYSEVLANRMIRPD